VTDLSKCLMPPPMSMFRHDFGADVVGVAKRRHNLVVVTQKEVSLYDFGKQEVVQKCGIGALKGKRVPALRLLENDNIVLAVG
jgi:hypothetical protein